MMQTDVEIRISFHGRKIFAKEPEFLHVAVLFFSVVCKVLHSERTGCLECVFTALHGQSTVLFILLSPSGSAFSVRT